MASVEAALRSVECVVSAEADFTGALVEYRDGYVEALALEQAVEDQGYDVTCVEER